MPKVLSEHVTCIIQYLRFRDLKLLLKELSYPSVFCSYVPINAVAHEHHGLS